MASTQGSLKDLQREIAERLRAEQALRESEQRFRELFEDASDVIYTHDLQGRFTSANKAALQFTGYTLEELTDMTVDNLVAPEDRQRAREMTRHKLQGLATTAYEIAILTKVGQRRSVEVSSRLVYEQGRPIGVQGIARDITERKRAEQLLRASEARYRSIIDTALDAVIAIDHEGRIVEWNHQAESMFGWQREEVLGRPLHETIIPGRYHSAHLAGLKRCVETGLPGPVINRRVELTGRRRSGEEFPVEISISMAKDADAITFSAFLRDITKRRAAEEKLARQSLELKHANDELERSNRALQQFAYVASHDLQEPLRAVSGYCKLIERRYRGALDAQADEFLTFAVEGADRMQRLIRDLLAYARIQTRAMPLEPTDCESVLADVLSNLKTAIDENGAQVTHGPLPTVAGDRSQLIQLFQNLIGNCIAYRGPDPPVIHVEAQREDDGKWRFSVRDNGIGIEPRHAQRIFEPFQRLHSRDGYPGGTGIGLAICKGIVERHGGRIWVESQPGQGATFYFTLSAGTKNADDHM